MATALKYDVTHATASDTAMLMLPLLNEMVLGTGSSSKLWAAQIIATLQQQQQQQQEQQQQKHKVLHQLQVQQGRRQEDQLELTQSLDMYCQGNLALLAEARHLLSFWIDNTATGSAASAAAAAVATAQAATARATAWLESLRVSISAAHERVSAATTQSSSAFLPTPQRGQSQAESEFEGVESAELSSIANMMLGALLLHQDPKVSQLHLAHEEGLGFGGSHLPFATLL